MARGLRAWILLLVVGVGPAWGAERDAGPSEARVFWNVLRQRGMNELLEHALTHADEADWVDAQLMRRELRLAIYADASRDNAEKLAALRDAIDVLDGLIKKRPDDPRGAEWRRTLGWELVHRQAEPYSMNILIKTPTADDRRNLLAVATRATEVFDDLLRIVRAKKRRIESLKPAAFEKAIDQLQRLNRLGREGEYFRHWAVFYQALARDRPTREGDKLLEQVLRFMVEEQQYTERPHDETGVQCEALVLAGMASRLLRRFKPARNYLSRAVAVAENIKDPQARSAVQWVEVLARLEGIKLARDQGDRRATDAGIRAFHTWITDSPTTTFGTRLSIALLEMNVYRARAEAARKRHDAGGYARWMTRSRRPLLELARKNPLYQDAIYETVYPLLGEVADISTLDAFEKNVFMAGLMGEATTLQRRIDGINARARAGANGASLAEIETLNQAMADKLDRAIEVADGLLTDEDALARELRPETVFNRAVCLYHRGDLLNAAGAFAEVADRYPTFKRAETAAGHAVDIAAQLFQDETLQAQPAVRELYLTALQVLTSKYKQSERARYAQFFLANVLDRLDRVGEAAVEYSRVDPAHPRYLDARYHRLLCLQRRLDALEAEEPENVARLIRPARTLADEARSFAATALSEAKRLREEPTAAGGPAVEDAATRAHELSHFAGDAELIAATVRCGVAVGDYAGALRIVGDFADRYADHRDLLGSALRVRILAHQGLRQFDEAAKIVDAFLRDEPEDAGPVVESLLFGVREDALRARSRGDSAAAKARTDELLSLAQRLWTWAQQRGAAMDAEQRLGIRAMLADAHLLNGEAETALTLFSACVDEDASVQADGRARHGPSLFGKAEALRALERCDEAVPLYNDVWTRTADGNRLWWQALAGSLDCHTQLGTSPRTILDSIAQHRGRDPRMGGPKIRAEFDRLENINRRK